MTVNVIHGDMRDVLGKMIAEGKTVQSVVTDAPYHLTTNKKGGTGVASLNVNSPAGRSRVTTGFMGKAWDGGDIAFRPGTWRLCFELLPPGGHLLAFAGTRTYHRMAVAIEEAGFEIRDTIAWLYGSGFPKSKNIGNGRGTALKPAMELICLARKPLDGTVAGNVLKHGTGALNIAGCRVGNEERTAAYTSLAPCHGNALGAAGTAEARRGTQGDPQTYVGRWPANVCHDGSDEVVKAFPDAGGGYGKQHERHDGATWEQGSGFKNDGREFGFGDSGSAARFFYSAKADAGDRLGSKHPTVKPVDLMRWLVRLITPPNGTVLDPFAGSGTTGMACMAEGIDCILVEREAEYVADIRARIAHVRGEEYAALRIGDAMTEEEARTKWCPFVRVVMDWSEVNPVVGPFNRDNLKVDIEDEETSISHALCIGSACMAWRWIYNPDGYCGLAGKP